MANQLPSWNSNDQRYAPFVLGVPSKGEDLSLGSLFDTITRRWPLILLCLLIGLGGAYAITKVTKKSWHSEAQLLFTPTLPNGTPQSQDPDSPPRYESIGTQVSLMLTKAQAERAAKVIADAAAKAGVTLDAKDIDPEELQTQLRLDNPEKTDLITIGFEGSTPEKAALLANGYAQAFIKWKKGIIHSNAKAYAMSLKDRLDQAKVELKTAQTKLQSFQQANDVSDVDEDTKSLTAMYAKREADQGDLDRDAEAAQAELNRLGALMRSESRKLKQQGWIRDDNLILKLQQQLADAEVERDHARLKYRDSFPGGLGPLDEKVTNLKGKIRTMVDESVGAEVPTLSSQASLVDQYRKRLVDTTYALARQNANKRVLVHMKTKLDKLPQLKKNYANYTREADGIAARVALLQSKYTSALADMLNAHNDVQQVGIATPPTKPSKPRATVNLALGLIAGAFLSVLATILAESRNPSINNVSDLRDASSAPVVTLKRKNGRLGMDALELCAMVNGFEGTETQGSKVVLVYEMTRSAGQRPGECLADGFARFGQATLYLELGAPGASDSWTPNGLTAILEEAQAGKSTTIYLPNLAGSKASGFSVSDLRSIVEAATKRFEVVVISTGPISDSPDAYLARPLTNVEVVFVTYGKVAITDLKEAQLHAQAMKGGQCLLVGRPRGHVLGVASDQKAA